MEPISRFLGATPEMMESCVLYGRIVNGFTIMFMLQNVFQSFLIAAERPHLGLWATISAGVTNMVLDAVFVGVLRWGVAGAALATGMSQTVGAVIPLVFFLSSNKSPLRLRAAKLEWKPIIKACGNGSSELMSNVSGSVVAMVYNFQLLRYLGENGVSAYGVLMYVQFIFVAIFVGYSVGSSPIISFHYGAQNTPELRNMFRKSVTLMSIAGVVLCVAAYLMASPLAKLFVGYDRELYELTCHAFRLYCLSFLLAGLNIFFSSLFTALNNGAVSAAISFLRTLLFQTGCVMVLPMLIDVDGLWLATLIADIFAGIISVIFLFVKRKTYQYF